MDFGSFVLLRFVFCFFVIVNSRYLWWRFACMLMCALLCLSVSSCLCSFESLLLRGVIFCFVACLFLCFLRCVFVCLIVCLCCRLLACVFVCLFVCLYVCFFVPIATLLNFLCCHSTQQAPCTSSELTTPHSTQSIDSRAIDDSSLRLKHSPPQTC